MNYLIVIFLFIIIILLIRVLYSLKYFNRGIVLDEEPKKTPTKTVENKGYSFLTEVKSFNKSLNEEDFDEKETQYLLSKEAEGWEYIKKEIIFSNGNDNNKNTKFFWKKEIK